MTDKDKTQETTQEKTPEQFGHKNPPIGPKSGNIVPDWRKDRDYEQFMPTPNL
jgi:hypothetical protein